MYLPSQPPSRPARHAGVAWSLLFSAMLVGAVFASDPPQAAPTTQGASVQRVRQVVEQQMHAFALADQDLRTQFGTADAFLATVREQYPMLMHPTSVLFLKSETDGSIAMQKVRIADEEGSSWTLTYLLNRHGEDQWRISGCVVTPEGRQILT